MRLALLLAGLALPMLELALLIKAGQSIGFWGVLLVIVATGALGLAVIRRQGLAMAGRLSEALQNREALPAGPALDGALQVVAGALLVAPGLLTDALGLVLMVPPVRWAAAAWIGRRLANERGAGPGPPQRSPGDGDVIEGEFERIDERDVRPRDIRKP